jgi:16S rRNA (guanine1516-N2)-methyltransferase
MPALHLDFTNPQLTYRRKHATTKRETLARAAGIKSGQNLLVLDATAGRGEDAFILAVLGCQVILLERSAEIYTLLNEAMQRARQCPGLAGIIERMQLIHTDALDWLQTPPLQPDIICLDPMFPGPGKNSKSALPKKSMQLFQAMIGMDTDADHLLPLALRSATQRVVVKRPRQAAPLANHPPDFCIPGKSSRFDIYLANSCTGQKNMQQN